MPILMSIILIGFPTYIRCHLYLERQGLAATGTSMSRDHNMGPPSVSFFMGILIGPNSRPVHVYLAIVTPENWDKNAGNVFKAKIYFL